MTKTRKRFFCILLAGFLLRLPFMPLSAYASTPGEADRLFTFAEKLADQQDYYRAITEYKRFLSYFPDDARVPLCRFGIAHAYRMGGKTDQAVRELATLEKDYAGSDTAEEAAFEIGRTYFSARRFEEAEPADEAFLRRYPNSRHHDEAQARLGWSLLYLAKYKAAARAFSSVNEKSPYGPFAAALAEELSAGVRIPRKSPVTAGVLSAVLPGAGQFYTRRPTEGISSFLLNGSFIWATVELFNRGSEVAGVLLGFFETGWYSGGIFGAVNDAHKFNRKARKDFIEELQNRYPLPAGQ
ncbi:MAG: tetratricopeptide repeat protein [Deltaproteobacteria bacterium]|nr:tetratricopeptide repeat protein [Deltaproteobacteria bacterium]